MPSPQQQHEQQQEQDQEQVVAQVDDEHREVDLEAQADTSNQEPHALAEGSPELPRLLGQRGRAGTAEEKGPPKEPRSGRPVDPIVVMCFVGVALFALAVIAGLVLQTGPDLNAGQRPPAATPCVLETFGYNAAIATKSWNLASPQWVFGFSFVLCFVLRQYVFRWATRRFYGRLPPNKQIKVANYMLELLCTSIVLALSIWASFWQLLVHPRDFDAPDPAQAERIAVGAQLTYVIFITTYLLELSFDQEMRLGLIMHHWTAILISVWGMVALSLMDNNVMLLRACFSLSLYMSTEQNVFVEMLLYQRRIYLPKVYYASAAYYYVSRFVIMIVSFKTWTQAYHAVFLMNVQDSWVVYSLWVFLPCGNVILNATQLTTVQSLLGIAALVQKRCHDQAGERRDTWQGAP